MRPEAPPDHSPPSGAADLRLMAQQLERGCRRLAESLKAAEQAEPEQMAELCACHLAEARRLRPALCAAASALRNRTQAGGGAFGPGHEDLERRVQCCVALLRQAAEAYRRLVGRASAELAGIDRELRRLQRGGLALRAYRGAAR